MDIANPVERSEISELMGNFEELLFKEEKLKKKIERAGGSDKEKYVFHLEHVRRSKMNILGQINALKNRI